VRSSQIIVLSADGAIFRAKILAEMAIAIKLKSAKA
jgi:hypothetical protein